MRWRLRLSEYTFDMVYKPGASHHLPDFLSRASTVAPPEDIYVDIPRLALAETANGLRTGRYTGADTSEPVEFDDVVEAQQTDDYCVEMSTWVERGKAKAFFRNEHHALYRRTPYSNQLVIPKSLRERVLTPEHHATVAAQPGMNRMYYPMRKAYYWPSMVTDIHTTITKCTTCAQNHLAFRRHATPLTLFPATEPLTELSVGIFWPIHPGLQEGQSLHLGYHRPLRQAHQVCRLKTNYGHVRGVSHHRRVGVRLRATGPDPIGPRAPVHVELLHRCVENAWH